MAKSSWQHRSEYYEREYHEIAKTLLKIKKMIDSLNLESGWETSQSPAEEAQQA